MIVGARRGPGWYVFVVRGCLGRVIGPFGSEQAAAYAAQVTEHVSAAPVPDDGNGVCNGLTAVGVDYSNGADAGTAP